GLHRAIRLRPGRTVDEVSRREVDPHYPPLDDGDLGLSDLRRIPRRALGVFGPGMGWVLGLGPGGKCLAHALVARHGVPALSHDSGSTCRALHVETDVAGGLD